MNTPCSVTRGASLREVVLQVVEQLVPAARRGTTRRVGFRGDAQVVGAGLVLGTTSASGRWCTIRWMVSQRWRASSVSIQPSSSVPRICTLFGTDGVEVAGQRRAPGDGSDRSSTRSPPLFAPAIQRSDRRSPSCSNNSRADACVHAEARGTPARTASRSGGDAARRRRRRGAQASRKDGRLNIRRVPTATAGRCCMPSGTAGRTPGRPARRRRRVEGHGPGAKRGTRRALRERAPRPVRDGDAVADGGAASHAFAPAQAASATSPAATSCPRRSGARRLQDFVAVAGIIQAGDAVDGEQRRERHPPLSRRRRAGRRRGIGRPAFPCA